FASYHRRIEKGASVFPAGEQILFKQAIKCGHQRGVSDVFTECKVNVSHADFVALPNLVEDLAFEFSQRLIRYFAGTLKPAQKKSRFFHLAAFSNSTR